MPKNKYPVLYYSHTVWKIISGNNRVHLNLLDRQMACL